jgi:hypothetical protein
MEKTPGQNEGLITTKCPGCGRMIDCPVRFIDRLAKCPGCQKRFTVSIYSPESVSKPKAKAEVLSAMTASVCQNKSMCGLSIASLALGVIACSTCWVPILGGLAIPTAMIGIFFGVAGWVVAVATKRTDGYLAGCGVFVCLTAVVVFVFAQAWFAAEVDKLTTDLADDDITASVRVDDGVVYVSNDDSNAWTDVTVTVCDDFSYHSTMFPGRTVSEIPARWFRNKEGRSLTLADYEDLDILIESDNGSTWVR